MCLEWTFYPEYLFAISDTETVKLPAYSNLQVQSDHLLYTFEEQTDSDTFKLSSRLQLISNLALSTVTSSLYLITIWDPYFFAPTVSEMDLLYPL